MPSGGKACLQATVGSVTGCGKFVVEGIGAASLSWAVVWRVCFCVKLTA